MITSTSFIYLSRCSSSRVTITISLPENGVHTTKSDRCSRTAAARRISHFSLNRKNLSALGHESHISSNCVCLCVSHHDDEFAREQFGECKHDINLIAICPTFPASIWDQHEILRNFSVHNIFGLCVDFSLLLSVTKCEYVEHLMEQIIRSPIDAC